MGLRELMKLIPEIFDDSEMPETVYHYTRIESFYEIINTKLLWSSDFRYLNDAEEVAHVFKLAFSKNEDKTAILDKIMNPSSDILDGWNYSMLSFSKCKDDISMWCRYGMDEGINIGLSKDIINYLIAKEDKYQKSVIGKCIYDKNLKDTIISRIARHYRYKEIVIMLMFIAPFLKNSSFSNEKEWRIVTKYKLAGIEDSGKPKFRVSGNKIIPYLNMELPRNENLINEIVLSPKLSQSKIPEIMIDDFLQNNGIKCDKIVKSESSLV